MLPPQAAGAQNFAMDVGETLPQEQVQRRTVEQIFDQGVQVVVELLEVFNVLVVLLVVFKVYTQDRVQLRWRRISLTFQFRMVAVRTQIFLLQRRLLVCRIRQIKEVFALFPVGK